MKKIISVLVAGMLLTACASQTGGGNMMTRSDGGISKQGVGTLAGAGLGAWAGSNVGKGKGNIAGIAIGTLLGAGLGSSVGASLDRADLAYYNQTSQQAMERSPSGQAVAWRNPDSGNYGTVTPMNVYEDNGQYCREYSQSIVVGGQKEEGFGKACRQPDGNWKIVQ